MNTLKRCLATLVALVMAASAFPATAFAETSSDQSKQVSAQEVEVESRLNPETGKQQSVEQKVYDDNELVTVIVELDAPAVMAQYQVSSYAAISEDSSAGQAVSEFLSSEESQQASQQILDGQQSIIDQISALSSNAGVAVASAEDGNGAGVVARWSNLLNGMAVRVPYGILGQIQQLDG